MRRRAQAVWVLVAVLGMLLAGMAVQAARTRARQQPGAWIVGGARR